MNVSLLIFWITLLCSFFPTQSVQVLVNNSTVSILYEPSNVTKIWDTTEAKEFHHSSINYSIQITKTNNQYVNVNANVINLEKFSITTENCTILLDGYNELQESLEFTQTESEIIIQDQIFKIFQTTNLVIGFRYHTETLKLSTIQTREPCCMITSNTDIILSNSCTCMGDMTIVTTSGSISIPNTITLIADHIEITATEMINLSNGKLFGDSLMIETQGEIKITISTELHIPQVKIDGSSVTVENFVYDSTSISMNMNISAFSEGINFCGPQIDSLYLFGTSNIEIGVYVCPNVISGDFLYVDGESISNKGVLIENDIICTVANSCFIYGSSNSQYGVHLNTNSISGVFISGESNLNSGIYFKNEMTGTQNFTNLECYGNGTIGVEIILTKNTLFETCTIIGTSKSIATTRYGIHISQTSSVEFSIKKGNFEGKNGSIKLPPTIILSSVAMEPNSGLSLKSNFEINFNGESQNIAISLGKNKFEIINAFFRTSSAITISGESDSIFIIPNNGFINGNLIFSLFGSVRIFKGIEAQGTINWSSSSATITAELCGDIKSTNTITLSPKIITKCYNTENNFLTISATNTIHIYQLDGNTNNFLQPPIIMNSNHIEINKPVSFNIN